MAAWCIKIQWSTSSRLWDRGHVQGMFFCLCYQHTCSLCFHGRDDSIAVCFYQFAGFDPFERSTYFGPFFDLGQVRKIFSLRSCVDRYIITCIPYSFKSFLTLLGFLKFGNVVWTLSTNISPFDLPGLAWSQGKENLEQFVGWRGWSHLSESLCVQSDFSTNILDRWIFSVRLCSMPKQFTLPCYFMAHMHPKRTDLSKEYGYKALAQRRKRSFNLQWFRFGFALPCLHWWYLIKLIWLLHWLQRIGGSWDGYWLTESLLHDGDGFSGGVAY